MARRHGSGIPRSSRAADTLSALAPIGQGWRLPLDALLLGLLLFAAFSYGATEPWSQQLVALGTVLATLYVLGAVVVRTVACRPVGSWTYVPIVVFLALAALQTLPLPVGLVGVVAEGSLTTRTELLADLGPAPEAAPVSLLPAATWRTLWALLPVVAVFVLVLHAYRTEAGVRRCCELLALSGGAVALYAVYQHVAKAPLDFGGAIKAEGHSGPFINHSHFGQFVNLGIGGALAVLLMRLSRAFKVRGGSARRVWRELRADRRHATVWAAAALVALGAATVALSMTRGGTIALMIAGGIIGLALVWFGGKHTGRGGDKAAVLLSLGLIAVVALLVLGFDQVYARFAEIGDLEAAEGGRLQILRDLWPAFTAFPLLGTGLGTFEVVFPQYDTDVRQSLTTHAENEYAQLLLETGLVGIACVVGFLAVVGAAAWRVVRRPTRSLDYAAFGLSLGMIAILLHSVTDFGQHLPSVALMTAVTAATLLNLAALHRARPADEDASVPQPAVQVPHIETAAASMGPRPLRWLGPVSLAALALASVGAALALDAPQQARTEFADAEKIRLRVYGPDAELVQPGDDERMIRHYARAAELDPSVPPYAYHRDYFTWGLLRFDADGQPRTAPDDPDQRAAVDALLADLADARRAAPTFGPSHRLAGEVHYHLLGDQDIGAALVAQGQRLTPHDPFAAFTAGSIAARAGDEDVAIERFERATALSPNLRSAVVDVCIAELDRPDLAHRFAQGDLGALQHLARLLAQDDFADAELVTRVDDEAWELLSQRAYADDPRPADLAAMARALRERGEYEESVALYRRAAESAPTQVGWRLELARLYAELGDVQEAVREARRCLQLRPTMKGASDLLAEQVTLLGAVAETEPRS